MAEWLAEAGINLNAGVGGQAHAPADAAGEQSRERMMRLLNAWRTEANAPEILAFDVELVDSVKSALKDQAEALEAMFEEVDEEERERRHFTSTLYQIEMERVRYSLARYLRTRILKIEDSLDYILTNLDMLDRLSWGEKALAQKLNELNGNHFEDHLMNPLSKMEGRPNENFTNADRVEHARPQLTEFVFIMALDDLPEVVMDETNDGNLSTLRRGEVWVVRYERIMREVLQGNAILL